MHVQDFQASDKASATFAPDQIGRTRYLTPEGFLLCEGVRIARTGAMLYTHAEMPVVAPDPSGAMITILREADVLFHPDTIASFAGRPVTNDHPPTTVTPDNFREYVVGTTLNPRRGEGVDSEFLIADLLIQDADTIKDIGLPNQLPEPGRKRKREISASYEVEVEQVRPGLGRQTSVVGNHVALVDRGRAGPTCAIQDKEPDDMAKRPSITIRNAKPSWKDRLRKAFKANDADAFANELEAGPDEDEDDDGAQRIVIEVAGGEADVVGDEDEGMGGGEAAAGGDLAERVDKLEAAVTALAEALKTGAGGGGGDGPPQAEDDGDELDADGNGDPTDDEAPGDDEKDGDKEEDKAFASDCIAKAEILAPGVKVPVMDAKSKPKRRDLTALRRASLKQAMAGKHRTSVEAVLGGRKPAFDKMPARDVQVVFDAAVALAKVANTTPIPGSRPYDMPQGPMTAARLQAMNEARRAKA